VGKGTYSTRVADALGAEHISAGDLVRAEVKKGSELGKQVRRRTRGGVLLCFCLDEKRGLEVHHAPRES